MTDIPKKDGPLQLTDTPNVAQVIRIYRELEREGRWYRRFARWLRPKKQEAEATVISIDRAARAKKHIDAAGKVVSVLDAQAKQVEENVRASTGRHYIQHDNEAGKAVAIDGLAVRPKSEP